MKKVMIVLFVMVLFLISFVSAADLLFLSDFETGDIQTKSSLHDGWSVLECQDYNAEVVSNIARAGNYSLHLQLYQQEDNFCFGNPRVQLQKLYPNPEARFQKCKGHWIGYSFYIPEDWPDIDDKGECMVMSVVWTNLHHLMSGPKGSSSGNETITVVWDPEPGTDGGCAPWEGKEVLYNKPHVKGEWVDWVIYYYPAIQSVDGETGIVKIWRNGILVANREGDNYINCWWGGYIAGPKIYKSDWDTDHTGYDYLHLYTDEWRILYDAEDNESNHALVVPPGNGSSPATQNYTVLKIPSPPIIDGDISEFNDANSITITNSVENSMTYKMLWDNNALYIAAQGNDDELAAIIDARDGDYIWNDDSIELFFDTLNNVGSTLNSDDYKFFVNLLNTQYDYSNGGEGVVWNTLFSSAVTTTGTLNSAGDTDAGYTIEVAIPWTDWVTPNENDVWGFDINLNDRNDTGTRIWEAWSQETRLNLPDEFGEIVFSSQVISSCSAADTNSDSGVDILEIMAYITEWKAGSVAITDLMIGIGEWKNGC